MKANFATAALAAALSFGVFGSTGAQAAPAAPAPVDASVQGGLLDQVRWVCGARGRNCVWRPGPGPRFVGPAPYRRCVTRVQRGPWGVRRVRTCR